MSKLKQIPLGAWIALSVLALSLAAILIWAPPTMWAALERADWEHIAGVIGLVGAAVVPVLAAIVKAFRASDDEDASDAKDGAA